MAGSLSKASDSAIPPGRPQATKKQIGCPSTWIMKQLDLAHYLKSPALTEHCCIVLYPQVPHGRPPRGLASKHTAMSTYSRASDQVTLGHHLITPLPKEISGAAGSGVTSSYYC